MTQHVRPQYKLLSATPSPYARKVRIQLAEKGIPFELITEVPWNTDTVTPQYNPLEKLPVLIEPLVRGQDLGMIHHAVARNGDESETHDGSKSHRADSGARHECGAVTEMPRPRQTARRVTASL